MSLVVYMYVVQKCRQTCKILFLIFVYSAVLQKEYFTLKCILHKKREDPILSKKWTFVVMHLDQGRSRLSRHGLTTFSATKFCLKYVLPIKVVLHILCMLTSSIYFRITLAFVKEYFYLELFRHVTFTIADPFTCTCSPSSLFRRK